MATRQGGGKQQDGEAPSPYLQESERFRRIFFGELRPYIESACADFGRSFRHLEARDLEQECAIKLLALMRTGKFDDRELAFVFKRAVYNLLRDIWRTDRRTVQFVSFSSELAPGEEDGDGTPLTREPEDTGSPGVIEEISAKEYEREVRRRLGTELQRQVFDLLLSPNRELVRLAEADFKKNPFGSTDVTIRAKHISTRLKVSPATVSRAIQQIRQAASDVQAQEAQGRGLQL